MTDRQTVSRQVGCSGVSCVGVPPIDSISFIVVTMLRLFVAVNTQLVSGLASGRY